MNYHETVEYLFAQLPMYQKIGQSAYKNSLETTLALDRYCLQPHRRFKTIHVAGTNGKGSVSHMIASVLQEAGYKTGLYTSPHLKDYRERIKVNGKMISEQFVVDYVQKYKSVFENLKPSFFEMSVALAFEYFAAEKVDVAVIETGMGGRLDSTNIITPLVSVITNISFDHMQFLGETLEKIAGEKAGIIKQNIPVVVGEADSHTRGVFMKRADELNAPLFLASLAYSAEYSLENSNESSVFNIFKGGRLFFAGIKTDLKGFYQRKNIVTVIQTLEILQNHFKISANQIFSGLMSVRQNTGLNGRWEILGKNPLTVCDTGHNEAGISEVVSQIRLQNFKNLHFVLGTVNDKDISKILQLLPKEAVYYFTKASIPRALNENILAERASEFGLSGNTYSTVKEAFSAAKQNAATDDMIFVGGSTFVVAEVV
jgi:dihydrofolate synthase/folylpolyglutamate synthase